MTQEELSDGNPTGRSRRRSGTFSAGQRDVDTYVGKLNAAAPGWVFIHTHYWIGYRLWPERQETP